jgi:hypothetical protein
LSPTTAVVGGAVVVVVGVLVVVVVVVVVAVLLLALAVEELFAGASDPPQAANSSAHVRERARETKNLFNIGRFSLRITGKWESAGIIHEKRGNLTTRLGHPRSGERNALQSEQTRWLIKL